jgi:hypothetical protein
MSSYDPAVAKDTTTKSWLAVMISQDPVGLVAQPRYWLGTRPASVPPAEAQGRMTW